MQFRIILTVLESLPFIRYEEARLRPKKKSTGSGSTLSLPTDPLSLVCQKASFSGLKSEMEFNLGSLESLLLMRCKEAGPL
jgi:hypothetical protein